MAEKIKKTYKPDTTSKGGTFVFKNAYGFKIRDIKPEFTITKHDVFGYSVDYWLRFFIEFTPAMNANTITAATVDTSKWSEDEQLDFIEGWEDAGGYMGDSDSPSPWCCPWFSGQPVINVQGSDPYTMGKNYWRLVKNEVEKEI